MYMTIHEALTQKSASLKAAGIKIPSLDASLLLAHILKTSRTALTVMRDEPLSEKTFAAFCAFIDRRLNGECIAYITGRKEFYGLEFLVNPAVLVPRPETETLIEAALGMLKTSKEQVTENRIRVLDLCTGSGAIAIVLKYTIPELEVFATDISKEALEVARENAERLLGNSTSIKFLQGDLYNALPAVHCLQFSAHCIISNPPYISSDELTTLPAEVQNEPHLALNGGCDGLDIIRTIIANAPGHLCPGGFLLLEADPRQIKNIAILLEKRGFREIIVYKDLSGLERVIGGVYK